MGFKSTLKLDSPIFDRDKRRAAGSRAVRRSAKTHRENIRKKMVFGKPTGKFYRRERGSGFGSRIHRASAVGERPAVFTGNLANNAVKERRLSETSAEVFIDEEIAPYVKTLKKTRVLISTEDHREAQDDLNKNLEAEFRKLAK